MLLKLLNTLNQNYMVLLLFFYHYKYKFFFNFLQCFRLRFDLYYRDSLVGFKYLFILFSKILFFYLEFAIFKYNFPMLIQHYYLQIKFLRWATLFLLEYI